MPITFVDRAWALRQASDDIREYETLPTVFIKYQEHFYGLVVKIVGIRNISATIDDQVRSKKCILGTIGLDDRVITVLDIYEMLNLTPPAAVHQVVGDDDNSASTPFGHVQWVGGYFKRGRENVSNGRSDPGIHKRM